MDTRFGDPLAARLGIGFGVWFFVLLYLLVNGIWLGVAVAVLAGIALIYYAIRASKDGARSR